MIEEYIKNKVPLLVQRAKQEGWCVYEDHCLLRCIYDYACRDDWRKHIAKPAYKNLNIEQARRVKDIIDKLETAPPQVINLLNYASLKWRNKL